MQQHRSQVATCQWPPLALLTCLLVLSSLLQFSRQQQCEAAYHGDAANCDQTSASSAGPRFNRYSAASQRVHYLLYDVNFSEGFNLRRDVYMRMAALAKRLGPNWRLVLPEWSNLPHWTLSPEEETRSKQWSTYFDLQTVNQFVNVIEMEQFLELHNHSRVAIDSVLSLEHSENFHDSDFTEMYEINESTRTRNYENVDGAIANLVDLSMNERFEYKQLYEIKIEGFDSTMARLIEKHFAHSTIVLVSNAEVILHSNYGDRQYWLARRSMRFAAPLRDEAKRYREAFLNSTDAADDTEMPLDWRLPPKRVAKGGPYIAVHFRRADFLLYRSNRVPEIDCAVQQIHFVASNLLEEHIAHIYVSTDAADDEWHKLKRGLELKQHTVFNYARDTAEASKLTPGEVAIIDQLIASHARHFVGTLESTFSYQISAEREILALPSNSSFSALCPKCDLRLMLKICRQESMWKIVY